MKALIIILSLVCIGCQKKDEPGKEVQVLHGDGYVVPLGVVPNDVEVSGNLGMVPALFKIKQAPLHVFVKNDEKGPWIELQPGLTGEPTYVYDASAAQIRFKWCFEGWAYAVDLY